MAKDGKMAVKKHKGFWSPMDTLRDRNYLEELWANNNFKVNEKEILRIINN